ncbi:alkyl hydroperoxide reductase AhpD [Sphaerisporangium rufum]|uniref:Alkyl hydroperoxide reductase AhpD n=1 Tax=Sphaerisporangium rufum TaxID=1381558 RepID=A0A919R246_9ACTN|nr:carboxymuconolactone decarboxylase family protein [Sphaerisporangium rufum]GII77928.1 alkyl hydroperoxide reductase AhpD [Sphaerisporangium rufum]
MARFRYVRPVDPRDAAGRVAGVYRQIAADFGMARMPVFMTLSPDEDVLVAAWAAVRESLLAGPVPRAGREIVALGVSLANRCPFCVDAHTTLLHATGDHRSAETIAAGGTPEDPGQAALLAWARSTRAARAAAPPFEPGTAAEHIGTALAFHFINRMASALLTDNLLPGNLQRSRLVRAAGGRALAGAVRRRLPAGESLPLLDGPPAAPAPDWAGGAPAGRAHAALRAVAAAGGDLLGPPARRAVERAVAGWDGQHPPPGAGWPAEALPGLSTADRPGARLALLAAVAPYRITDAEVAAWRGPGRTDAELVRLVAFGAGIAVGRAEAAILAGARDPSAARAGQGG